MKGSCVILASVLLILSSGASHGATSLGTWSLRREQTRPFPPEARALRSVAFGNGVFVGVGYDPNFPIVDICFGDGKFAAVSPRDILLSFNADDWMIKRENG